jgi:hypothetical protein
MSGLVLNFPTLIVLIIWTVAATSLLLFFAKWCFYKGYQEGLDKALVIFKDGIQKHLQDRIRELQDKINEKN